MAATSAVPFTMVKRSAGGPPPPRRAEVRRPAEVRRQRGPPAGRAIGGPSAMTTKPCDAISLKYSGNMSPFLAQPPSPQTSTGCSSIESSRGR